jgi:SNF2 family DNA or RNA helicase
MTQALITHSNGVSRKTLEPYIKDEVEFYPHQVEGVRELVRRKSFILGDDMGLGKSLQALTVFAADVYRGWAETALVVCPVTLKGNWADEIEKFSGFPSITLEGTPNQRIKQLIEFSAIAGPKILICNYEQVVAHQDTLDSFQFDVAIFDEAHYLKNHKAKRTKACMDVYSRRSFMLTGTPMLNHVNELWTLLHRIGAYDRGYWQFVNRYAVFGGYKDKQIVGVKNEKELTELLNRYMVRRLKKDVLDLPEVQIIERRIDLLPEQRKLYDEVFTDMKLTRAGSLEPDDIENALTKFLRLKEICGTTYKFTGEDNSSKLDLAVADDIELLENGHKVVVFTQFRDMQACYAKRLADAVGAPIWQLHGDIPKPDRQPTVKEWSNTQEPGVLVCMLQIAGIGLNMTAARHASFLDKLFVPGLNQQAIDRLHRIGASRTQPVQVREYLARGTIENRVNQILRTKAKIFGEIVESDPDWKRKLVQLRMEDEAA